MPRRARPSLGRAGLGFHSFVPSPLSGRRSFSATSSRARCPPNLSKRERILHSSHEKHFLFGSRHPVNCPSSSSLCRASSTHCGFPLNGIPQEVSPNRLLSQELELPLDCSPCSPTAPTSFSPTPSTSFFLSFSHSASFLRSHSTYRPRSLASPSITSRSITSSSARICRPMKGNSSQTFFSSSLYPSVSSSRIPHRRSLVDTSLFTPCCRHNRYISATISCASLPLSRSRRRPISFLAVPLFSTCTVGGQRSFFSFSLSSLLATTDTSKIGQETPSNSVPQKKPAGSSEAAESGAIVMNSSDTEDTTVDLRRSSPSVHTPETAPEDSQGLPARDSAVVVEEKERDLSHATKEDRNEAPKIEENGQGKNHLEEYFLSPSGYDGPGDGSYRSALLQRIKEATADWASEGRMNSFVSDALASYKATVDLPWSVALPLLGCCLRIVTLPFAISAERDLRVRGLYGGELLERFKAAEEAKKKHGLGSPEWVKTQGKLKSFCKAHDLSVVPLSSLQLLFIAILVGCTSTALKSIASQGEEYRAFAAEHPGWFESLSLPDPTLATSFIAASGGLSLLLAGWMIADKLKRATPHSRLGSATAKLSPVLTRAIPAILTTCFAFYAGTSFPSGVVLMFLPAAALQAVFTRLFRFRPVERLLHFIPDSVQPLHSIHAQILRRRVPELVREYERLSREKGEVSSSNPDIGKALLSLWRHTTHHQRFRPLSAIKAEGGRVGFVASSMQQQQASMYRRRPREKKMAR